jgi:hypothetical protein
MQIKYKYLDIAPPKHNIKFTNHITDLFNNNLFFGIEYLYRLRHNRLLLRQLMQRRERPEWKSGKVHRKQEWLPLHKHLRHHQRLLQRRWLRRNKRPKRRTRNLHRRPCQRLRLR